MKTHTNQADFARLMNVSRKTVTIWKKRGYIEVSDGLVDVAASLAKLDGVGKGLPAAVTRAATSAAGNIFQASTALLWDTAGPDRQWAIDVSTMIDPWQLADLMLRYLPQAVVRSLIAEYTAAARRRADEILTEHGIEAPPPFTSWAAHPWFNPVLTEDDWIEYEAAAKAHMTGVADA